MKPNLARALVLTTVLSLTGLVVAACGSSSSSSSTTSAAASARAAAPSSSAVASDAAVASYCEPLQAAFAIKPPSGSQVSDEELAAFADALEPAAVAAQADGRQDLYDLFALVAQMNANPDSMTADEVNQVLTQIGELGPEVLTDCGIDLMS